MSEPSAADTSTEESVPETLPDGATPVDLADMAEAVRTGTVRLEPVEAVTSGLVTTLEFEPNHAHYAAGHRFEAQLFDGVDEKLAHLRGWANSAEAAVANLLDAVRIS
jgi:hypothetical protein